MCFKGEINVCNTLGFVDIFEVISFVRFILVLGNILERLLRLVIGF